VKDKPLYICIYVHECVHTHKHTHREKYRITYIKSLTQTTWWSPCATRKAGSKRIRKKITVTKNSNRKEKYEKYVYRTIEFLHECVYFIKIYLK